MKRVSDGPPGLGVEFRHQLRHPQRLKFCLQARHIPIVEGGEHSVFALLFLLPGLHAAEHGLLLHLLRLQQAHGPGQYFA